MATIINDYNEFKQILESSSVCMVDFFATWCGPCKMLSPMIDEISQEFDQKASIIKIDSDVVPDACAEYSIKLLPTLVFFKDGKEVDRIAGLESKETIVSKIQSLL